MKRLISTAALLLSPLAAAQDHPIQVATFVQNSSLRTARSQGTASGWGSGIGASLRISALWSAETSLRQLKLDNNIRYMAVTLGAVVRPSSLPLELAFGAGLGRYSMNDINGRRSWAFDIKSRYDLAREGSAWSFGPGMELTLNKPGERTLMILSPGVWFRVGF
jgi:hypothetical protein